MYDLLKELLLMFYYPISGLIDRSLNEHEDSDTRPFDPTLPTILIAKRWFNHNPLHIQRKHYLEDKGFNVFYYFQSLSDGTWEDSAQNLHEFIIEHDLHNITLVGISGGGITAYLYLQKYGGWDHVRRFISIATPFGGTWQELFLSFNESCKQLTPTSDLVKDITQEEILHPGKIFCMRAEFDELVTAESSLLPGTTEIVIPVKGHNNLHLLDNTVYDKIAEIARN